MNIIEAFREYASNLQIEQAFDQFLEDYDLDHDTQLALVNYCAGELVSTFATMVALNEDADLQDLFEQFCEELELSDAYSEILARCIEESAEEFDNDNDAVEFDAPFDQDVRERKLRAFLKKTYTAISGRNSPYGTSWAVPFITNLSVPGLWGNDKLTNEEILYGPGAVSSSVFDQPARKRCNIDEDMNGAINQEDYFTEKRVASNMLPYLASLERTSFKK